MIGQTEHWWVFSDGLDVSFSGAVGTIEGRVLGARKATSVRHCTDGEEISQGKEVDTRISAQVLYMVSQKNTCTYCTWCFRKTTTRIVHGVLGKTLAHIVHGVSVIHPHLVYMVYQKTTAEHIVHGVSEKQPGHCKQLLWQQQYLISYITHKMSVLVSVNLSWE